jgi:hypothetical protein
VGVRPRRADFRGADHRLLPRPAAGVRGPACVGRREGGHGGGRRRAGNRRRGGGSVHVLAAG